MPSLDQRHLHEASGLAGCANVRRALFQPLSQKPMIPQFRVSIVQVSRAMLLLPCISWWFWGGGWEANGDFQMLNV